MMGECGMCMKGEDKKNRWVKGKEVMVGVVKGEIGVMEDR